MYIYIYEIDMAIEKDYVESSSQKVRQFLVFFPFINLLIYIYIYI